MRERDDDCETAMVRSRLALHKPRASGLILAGTGAFLAFGLSGCATGPNAPGHAEFRTPLPIPPLAESHLDVKGRRVFDLETRSGSREFRPGVRTPTWGINGNHLGPTLRMTRGDRVLIRLRNALTEATTMHWHGMELPAEMDGSPHQLVEPGEVWSPTWSVDQPAATLWYHPHPHGATEHHLYTGLAGFILVDDSQAETLSIPSTYGVDDIPLLVQDVAFDDNGALVRRKPWYNQVGPLGRTILVNGALTPFLEVTRDRIRLRLLNASIARVYNFGLSDDREFDLVATDGGLLAEPHRTRRIQLSPGERAEIVIAVQPGDRVALRSFPQELRSDFANNRFSGGRDTFELMELRARDVLEPSPPVPNRLASIPDPEPEEAERTRHVRVSSRTINGRAMDMARVDARIAAGTVEIWEVEGIAVPHNLHIHGVRFRVLDVDGVAPGPELAGWKDTVYLDPDVVTRLLIRFPHHVSPDVPYMFHCHFLRHEDDGAMGQYLVVPGE